jgi:plasmid maintenance system antidote protein VapI
LAINSEDINLKKLKGEMGLTYDEIAGALGVAENRAITLVHGRDWPNFEEKLKIYGLKKLAEKGELNSEEF